LAWYFNPDTNRISVHGTGYSQSATGNNERCCFIMINARNICTPKADGVGVGVGEYLIYPYAELHNNNPNLLVQGGDTGLVVDTPSVEKSTCSGHKCNSVQFGKGTLFRFTEAGKIPNGATFSDAFSPTTYFVNNFIVNHNTSPDKVYILNYQPWGPAISQGWRLWWTHKSHPILLELTTRDHKCNENNPVVWRSHRIADTALRGWVNTSTFTHNGQVISVGGGSDSRNTFQKYADVFNRHNEPVVEFIVKPYPNGTFFILASNGSRSFVVCNYNDGSALVRERPFVWNNNEGSWDGSLWNSTFLVTGDNRAKLPAQFRVGKFNTGVVETCMTQL
jgi:hypothetical protein